MRKKDIASLFLYVTVAGAGLSLAAIASSYFFTPVQANTNQVAQNEAVPAASTEVVGGEAQVAPNATNEAVGVPEDKHPGFEIEGQKESKIDMSSIFEEYDYNPEGKKDPFEPYEVITGSFNSVKPIGPVKPLQNFDLEQLKVTGIIWGVENPMAVVHTPSDEVFYVKEREKIGRNNGYVAQIREGEIVVIESFVLKGEITSQAKILTITSPANSK